MPSRPTKWLTGLFQPKDPADVPLKIKGASGQTGKLLQIVDSADAEVFSILKNGDGAVKYAEVTVSTAEILALFATPKTLVAAPGAGRILEFLGALIILDFATVAYDGVAAGEDLAIKYTNAAGAIASTTLETTGFIDQAADQIRTFKPIVTDLTPVANSPLVLHLLTAEIATGDSPLRVKVAYRVHSTGL